jgi:FKBP-type peptidyl-prolyl cis-trans isomerase
LRYFGDEYTKVAIIFPLLKIEELLSRNNKRNIEDGKFIPENVIRTMIDSYQTIKEIEGFDKEIQAYIKKNKLDLNASPSGLYYKITKEGEGRLIQYTDSVSISYKGKLLNGRIFDYTKEPLTFAVKGLIGGWKETLLSLKTTSDIGRALPPSATKCPVNV